MIFDRSAEDPALALWCAENLQILEGAGDKSQIGVNALQASGIGNSQQYFPASATQPAFHWVRWPGCSLVLVAGTSSMYMAGSVVGAYLRAPTVDDNFHTFRYFNQTAFYFRQLCQSQGRRLEDRTYFIGHSLGGGLAQIMARFHLSAGQSRSPIVLTFGSIPVGDAQWPALNRTIATVRYMNDTDPVPLIPPDWIQNEAMNLAITNASNFGFRSAYHTHGGVVLDPFGRPTPGIVPPLGTIRGGAELGAWIYKAATDQSSAHSIDAYVARIRLMQPIVTPPATVRVVGGEPQPANPLDRRALTVQQQQAIDTIIRTGARQNAVALGVPPDRAFKTVKQGPLWWVTFGGFPVACGGTRRRAGALATRGNSFLRKLQRMAGVDINALYFLLGIYLDQASQPNNGFTPPIATFDSTV